MAGLMIQNPIKMKHFKSKHPSVTSALKQPQAAKTLMGAAIVAVGVFGSGLHAYGAPNTPNSKVKPQISIVLPSTPKPISVGTAAGQEDSRITLPVNIPIQNGYLTGLKAPAPSTSINSYNEIIAYLLSSLQGSIFYPLLGNSAPLPITIPNDQAGNLITPTQPQAPISPPGQAETLEARDAAAVPGPLPLLGLASAFGCSRRLRQRINLRRQN